MSSVWSDPEYRKEYGRKYREEHRDELNEKQREKRRNRPAAPGVRGRGNTFKGFADVAYCQENRLVEELSWGIDKEKIRRNAEE